MFLAENTFLRYVIVFCIKNLIIARLYVIIRDKSATLFSYNRQLNIQMLLIWLIASISELVGAAVKHGLFLLTYGETEFAGEFYMDFPEGTISAVKSIYCVLGFLVSFGLCFGLIIIFRKVLKYDNFVVSALIISLIFAPYGLIMAEIMNYLITPFVIFCILLLIPYLFFKLFSSIVYSVWKKRDPQIKDFRINAILCAVIGQFTGFVYLLISGAATNIFDLIINPFYYYTEYYFDGVYEIVFLGAIAVGILFNFIDLERWGIKPDKNKRGKRLLGILALSVINAPYLYLIPYLMCKFSV